MPKSAVWTNLHSGELYDPSDKGMLLRQYRYMNRVSRFNRLPDNVFGVFLRSKMLRRMFAEVGSGCYIQAPFHANFGGRHIHLGDNVYVNFNLTCVDDTHIYIGSRCKIGPNVTIATASHPEDPALRRKGLQRNLPVRIGENVWIGSGAVILPGVSVGDNSIIGAGSVVTKDIPANVVAVGSPCRVLRSLGTSSFSEEKEAKRL